MTTISAIHNLERLKSAVDRAHAAKKDSSNMMLGLLTRRFEIAFADYFAFQAECFDEHGHTRKDAPTVVDIPSTPAIVKIIAITSDAREEGYGHAERAHSLSESARVNRDPIYAAQDAEDASVCAIRARFAACRARIAREALMDAGEFNDRAELLAARRAADIHVVVAEHAQKCCNEYAENAALYAEGHFARTL